VPRAVRYYLYVSTAKLDMLVPQLPRRVRRRALARTRAWNLGFGPRVARASLSDEFHIAPGLHQRVDAVERALTNSGEVGGLTDEAPWVRETMEMRWSVISSHRSLWKMRATDAVLFWRQGDASVILLGGSARHVVGISNAPEVDTRVLDSGTSSTGRWLLGYRSRMVAGALSPTPKLRDRFDQFLARCPGVGPEELAFGPLPEVPTQRLTFLARRHVRDELVWDPAHQQELRVTLGTPLYVALADST
jgi:hypothetical protein